MVTINGAIRLPFIIDSGASDVTIPDDVMLTLMRTGTITEGDFLGKRNYKLADGSTTLSTRFRIRSLKVGDRVLENVAAGTTSASGEALLGQSFLRRFRSWSIDNGRGVLVLE
jgi:aspartyl protease family protein